MSPTSHRRLCELTGRGAGCGRQHGGQRVEASGRAKNHGNDDEQGVRRSARCSRGPERACMYCEVSLGTPSITLAEGEYPAAFAGRTTVVGICNSDHKGEVPGTNGARSSTRGEDPAHRFATTGKEGSRPRAKRRSRRSASIGGTDRAAEAEAVWYGAREGERRALRGSERSRPFASVLSTLVACAADPSRRALLHPACVAVIESHSEIRSWPWDAATTRGTTR